MSFGLNGEGVARGKQRYGNSLANEFDESQVKRDEDGKFMGKTRSGKDVYSKFEHPGHTDFDKSDHEDAAEFHRTERDKADSDAIDAFDTPDMDKHYEKSGYHTAEGQKHTKVAVWGPKGPPKKRAEKGAETPGKKKGPGKEKTAEEMQKEDWAKKDAALAREHKKLVPKSRLK